jgi:competence protein ComEC
MRIASVVGLFAAIIGIALLCVHEFRLLPDPHAVVVRFFNVGQGDSIFVTGPSGEQVLIDGGPDLTALEDLGDSMPFFDRSIDWLVLTHPHLDHVAAFPEILERYSVGHVLITAAAYDNGPYQEFLRLLKEKHIPIVIADPKHDLTFDDGLAFDVLWPPPMYFGQSVKSIHDTCIVMKMTYGTGSILLTGDAETKTEDILESEHVDLHSTILKVGHHGSNTSSSTGFLINVAPKIAVISVGKDNKYGLPKRTILSRLAHFHIPTITTMSGTITVTMTKNAWSETQ